MNNQIIFVSDEFLSDSGGGAEQSTESLILCSPFTVKKIKTDTLTAEFIIENKEKFWIFGNYNNLDFELVSNIITHLQYAVIEYDMKFCFFRSPMTHFQTMKEVCECGIRSRGMYVSAFLSYAKKVFWMSRNQMDYFYANCPPVKPNENYILSSIFDLKTLNQIKELRETSQKNNTWIVIGSTTWMKGKDQATEYCEIYNLDYEVVWGIPYDEMLRKLAQAKGLVFLPYDGDTCPRLVIEAKLLRCELVLNNYVQHKDESWFATDNINQIEDYLMRVPFNFWNEIDKLLQTRDMMTKHTSETIRSTGTYL